MSAHAGHRAWRWRGHWLQAVAGRRLGRQVGIVHLCLLRGIGAGVPTGPPVSALLHSRSSAILKLGDVWQSLSAC